jgi:predicted dehydrogenase
MSIKVGLIGCGHIGTFHARNIRDIQSQGLVDIRYHAVCDRIHARAERFAVIAGCDLVSDDPRAVIDACDAVYICTETAEHPELVAMAAAAGRHVFCEKPLAMNLADAQSMADAVRQAGVTNQVGLVLHYSPVFRVLDQLASGPAGDGAEPAPWGALLTAHLRDDQFFPVGGQYGSTWRADVSRAGGGTLLEHSIHDVDLLRRLFGEIEQVRCITRNIAGHPGIEDVALVTFHHRGGHQTTLTSVWHGVEQRPSSRHLEVFYERARVETFQDYFGTITVEQQDQPAVTVSSDEVLARFMDLEGLHPRQEDLRLLAGLSDRRFLQAVAEGRPAAPGFDDALIAHRIVDACYRSAREGREVVLTEPAA